MTAVTTRPSTATNRPSDLWVTSLFASRPAQPPSSSAAGDAVSARSAFQAVVHGRATLLDVRTAEAVASQGRVHPDLFPLALRMATGRGSGLSVQPAAIPGPGVPLIVMADDDQTARRVSVALRHLTARKVVVLRGGFEAWHADGLPRVDPATNAA